METKTENGGMLRVKYSSAKSLELMDFVKSCAALASEYNDFASAHNAPGGKLYIREVRKGSIEMDLVSDTAITGAVQTLMSIPGAVNTLADFVGHLRSAWTWLVAGAHSNPQREIGPRTLENISKFVNPTAKENDANITINVLEVGGDVNAPIIFATQDANVVQNVVHRIETEGKSSNVTRRENAVLRWYQSRNDASDSAGDRAIIESVSAKPIRTVFADTKLKTLLLSVDENIFKSIWLVDVSVESYSGHPVLYRIERIERLAE